MITELLVIQKIEETTPVEVFQISGKYFQWTFQTHQQATQTDKPYFPFEVNGQVNVLHRKAGHETKVTFTGEQLAFFDDYGVPGGTVIGVLLPKLYIPDILRFNDKPVIPAGFAGQMVCQPPGQLQILYNKAETRAAVLLHIDRTLLFGFKCIAKKVTPQLFPEAEQVNINDLFDFSISRELLEVDVIRNTDLALINKTFNQADLDEVVRMLNEILDSIKEGNQPKAKSLLPKAGSLLMNGTSVASSLITIADSYHSKNAAFKLVGKLMGYHLLS